MTILQTWTWLQTLSWSLEELAGRAGTPGRLHSPAKRGRFNNYKLTKNRMMMRPMMAMTIMVPSWNDSLWMSSAECWHTWNHQCHEDLLYWKWFWGQKWRKDDSRSHLILPVLCPHQSGCHHPPVRWDCHHVMRGRKTTTCTPSSPSCPGTSSGGRWWCRGSTGTEPSPAQTKWTATWADLSLEILSLSSFRSSTWQRPSSCQRWHLWGTSGPQAGPCSPFTLMRIFMRILLQIKRGKLPWQ